ncbi:MAG: lipopolysaccharide transport system permease protein [uncultured Candidatus Poseidoniales archaeon]|jgi:ABC-type polysaccharide/polyol phosphate export permease|nr:MAG: lipopolysaccharide transport system permease protein [uncultured Candidatus Poseidoniales archaeon]
MDKTMSGENIVEVGLKPPLFKAPIYTLREVLQNKFLIRNLVVREIRGKYRNALLGYTWTFIEPALLAIVYYFLFYMLAGNPDELYAMWVLIGIIIWGCFGRSLQASVSSLTRNKNTIHLVYFPRIVFPMTAVMGNIVTTLMSCVVVFPIMMIFNLPLTIYALLIPASVFLAGFLATGIGVMLAPLNCIYRDIEHLIRFIVRAGFFVSPVMWTYEMALERGMFGEAAVYNPMLTPITLARHGLEGHATTLPSSVIGLCIGFGILTWLIGSYVFEKYERRAVKYL